MRAAAAAALILSATLALSCAGPRQLARQSEKELDAGNVERAYELARRAVERTLPPPRRGAPDRRRHRARGSRQGRGARCGGRGHPRRRASGARAACAARRPRALSGRDPGRSGFLEREGGSWTAPPRSSTSWAISVSPGSGREAYRHYQAVEVFNASYRDVQEKQRLAHQQAMTRVAIAAVRERCGDRRALRAPLADEIWHEVSSRLAAKDSSSPSSSRSRTCTRA